MAALTSRRERRAAWRAVRPFMEGGAIDMRRKCYEAARDHTDPIVGFCTAYDVAFGRLLNDLARPKHAARTAQWRAMWIDPKAGYLARPARP